MKKSLYLHGGGALARQQNTLTFTNNVSKPRYIPINTVADIHALGQVTVNTHLLSFLSEQNIPMHIYTHNGHYAGSYMPYHHKGSGKLTLAQASHYNSGSKRLSLAKAFVKAALKNIDAVLSYYRRRGKEVKESLDHIRKMSAAISKQQSTNALMALEGSARDSYYRAWDAITETPAFRFDKRSRRPPKNAVNALISFGNTLLYGACLSELHHVQLDPRIGFLHATNERNYTLNLDLAEIFKPIIVDRIIFTLINKKIIKPEHFRPVAGGTYLNDEGMKIVLTSFDKRLKDSLTLKGETRPSSYRYVIRKEGYKLEKYFLGEAEYTPFLASW